MGEYTQIAVALLGAIIALLGWALANMSRNLTELRNSTLTVREHNEYREQIKDRWLTQADINRQAVEAYMQTKSYDAWKAEFDLTRSRQEKIDFDLRKRVEALEQRK